MTRFIGLIFGISTLISSLTAPLHAQEKCDVSDKLCVMAEIKATADKIEKQSWRDKSLRELAKAYTHEGYEDKAIALIAQIKTPDTKAMTIRGIGMAAADNKWNDEARYNTLFKKLTAESDKIEHAPSKGIAYTYIAMSQAFAGNDKGAFDTAKAMENDALRNKAFGESAEIQAEQNKFIEAMKSIAEINNLAFRNKAYATVSEILTKKGHLPEAYNAAQKIENPYMKTQTIQKIVNYGNKEETLK